MSTSTQPTTRTSLASSSASSAASTAASLATSQQTSGSGSSQTSSGGLTLPTLTSASLPSTRPTTGPANTTLYLLPKTVSAKRYDLLLRFDHDPYSDVAEAASPRSLSYTGEVTITITAVQATNRIVMHMDRNVVLTTVITVTNLATSQPITVTNSAYDAYQWYDINLGETLSVGTDYQINIKFRSQTTKDGFYYHGYEEPGDLPYA